MEASLRFLSHDEKETVYRRGFVGNDAVGWPTFTSRTFMPRVIGTTRLFRPPPV